jgi:hypothetical protein
MTLGERVGKQHRYKEGDKQRRYDPDVHGAIFARLGRTVSHDPD